MLLLYTSDLHGSEPHYRALLEAVRAAQPDLLILGGDMFPDDSPELPEQMGTHQPRYVLEEFRTWLAACLKSVARMTVLSILGNHDWLSSALALEEIARQNPRLLILSHQHTATFNGLNFSGYSKTPPTPWFVKDFERLDLPGDYPPPLGGACWDSNRRRAITAAAKILFARYPSMAEDLESLAVPPAPWVFVAHAPPYETALDRSFRGDSYGSRTILATIQRHQPLLSLHGHIHESPDVTGSFRESIGATVAVNVGQHADGLYYALIEIDVPQRRIVRVERCTAL